MAERSDRARRLRPAPSIALALGLPILAGCAQPPPPAPPQDAATLAKVSEFDGRWTAQSAPTDATGSNVFATWRMTMVVSDGVYRAEAICSTAHPVNFQGTVAPDGSLSPSVSNNINMAQRRLTGRLPNVEIGAWGAGNARCGQARFNLKRGG